MTEDVLKRKRNFKRSRTLQGSFIHLMRCRHLRASPQGLSAVLRLGNGLVETRHVQHDGGAYPGYPGPVISLDIFGSSSWKMNSAKMSRQRAVPVQVQALRQDRPFL